MTPLLLLALAGAPQVFCYVETLWGGVKAEELDLAPCTHVIEAFLLPDASGAVRAANGLPRPLLLRAARKLGARTLVAVGGATIPGATFAAIAADAGALHRFADALAEFAAAGGYDGVDLDWEFPSPAERALLVKLVGALRQRLGPRALISIGVSPGAALEGYDFAALAPLADAFVHFGYDFRNPALGPWANDRQLLPDGAAHPIEASVRGAASEIVRRGAPREKLIVALPMYASDGRPWTQVRAQVLASAAPLHPLFLENEVGGVWVSGPQAIEAKARAILYGSEIDGGHAAGVGLWQLGHQGTSRDLTAALRRALAVGR